MAERRSWVKNLRGNFTTPAIQSLVIMCGVLLSSCSQQVLPSHETPEEQAALQSLPASTTHARPAGTPTAVPADFLTPAAASTTAARIASANNEVNSIPAVQICPPLDEVAPAELKAAVSNPFNPPVLGSDDPHQGVDLAIQRGGIALAGGRVQAVLPGVVAAILRDRFPYGNAVLIETLPQGLPKELRPLVEAQENPIAPVRSSLTCPDGREKPFPEGNRRSLYLLYAHMQMTEALEVGDVIGCGAGLGTVGQSGNALNPHLHLEVRAGPAGARFGSLAHYVSDASSLEMRNYCLWRVSGVFRLVNPLVVMGSLPGWDNDP